MEPASSRLFSALKPWQTSPEYQSNVQHLTSEKFALVADLLLENPNFNSSHLFRADILFDSTGTLKTAEEKERDLQIVTTRNHAAEKVSWTQEDENGPHAPALDGFRLERCVKRRLIPRNPQLDHPLMQTCYVYNSIEGHIRQVVVYLPHVETENKMPWYHPPVRALAYLFEGPRGGAAGEVELPQTCPCLSIHFLLFPSSVKDIPERLHRTFISLLSTFIRLSKSPSSNQGDVPISPSKPIPPSAFKDTILPQHIVQDTYARLKKQYASDLIARWVEKTEPSKHVFEDLSIAAFLIELWKQMYAPNKFPGFVDIACGNGVLVYILVSEGFAGRGFDARRRKTWDVLGIKDHLHELICIPEPFLKALQLHQETTLEDTNVHNGIFTPDTFIISNHADELTPWTPLLAALSSPDHPLPFLAIPCCSHALSGAKYRYSPKDALQSQSSPGDTDELEPQPASGDLKSLRAAKKQAATHSDDKSMYACLTKKVVAMAQELGFETELTLMRIPSTRNLGIVGNRNTVTMRKTNQGNKEQGTNITAKYIESMGNAAHQIIERECRRSGGVDAAARTWLQRIQGLQVGKGRGKVNLHRRNLQS